MLVVPNSVASQLLHRDDAQINFMEMLAVVLLVDTFGSFLSGSLLLHRQQWRPWLLAWKVVAGHRKQTCLPEGFGYMLLNTFGCRSGHVQNPKPMVQKDHNVVTSQKC